LLGIDNWAPSLETFKYNHSDAQTLCTDISKVTGEEVRTITKRKIDVIVMLQGDEPLINPDCLDELMQHHTKYPTVSVFNLTQYIKDDEDFYNVEIKKKDIEDSPST